MPALGQQTHQTITPINRHTQHPMCSYVRMYTYTCIYILFNTYISLSYQHGTRTQTHTHTHTHTHSHLMMCEDDHASNRRRLTHVHLPSQFRRDATVNGKQGSIPGNYGAPERSFTCLLFTRGCLAEPLFIELIVLTAACMLSSRPC